VIPPGVDLSAFAPAAGERAEEPTIFCAADAGEPRKRVALLVEAFRKVRQARPGARLVLSRPRGSMAASLLDEPDVELRDVDDERALAAAYREAWVSVLPSYSEAFGLVLVESLASGTPVVGSERDAIPEIIDRPEVGATFSEDGSLAGALLHALELSQDPATPAACRARAEEYSTERCTERYETLYEELLGRA
jgi:phosphatidyl-myo-inositol alpha-mannosyltransferase